MKEPEIVYTFDGTAPYVGPQCVYTFVLAGAGAST
jgi:hypothetical protein